MTSNLVDHILCNCHCTCTFSGYISCKILSWSICNHHRKVHCFNGRNINLLALSVITAFTKGKYAIHFICCTKKLLPSKLERSILYNVNVFDNENTIQNMCGKYMYKDYIVNGWQLAKMKKSIPDMSLP